MFVFRLKPSRLLEVSQLRATVVRVDAGDLRRPASRRRNLDRRRNLRRDDADPHLARSGRLPPHETRRV